MTQHVLATLGIYGGTLVVCFIAGLVQVINTEAMLLALSLWVIDDPAVLPLVALCAAVGQMAANAVFYLAGRGLFALPKGRWHDRIERAKVKVASWNQRPNLMLAAASVIGLPPLFLVAVAAGGLRISLVKFLVVGIVGRWLRFAIVLAIPWL